MNSKINEAGKYRLSLKAIAIYVALWAVFFALVRVLVKYSSLGATGSYPYSAGLVTDYVLPVAIGFLLVAVGVAVAYLLGKKKHAWGVAVWCFVIGCLALPVLWGAVMVLSSLGILDLD